MEKGLPNKQMNLIIRDAKSLFKKLPLDPTVSPSSILEYRVDQLTKLINYEFPEKSLHYEILRYHPISVICLYEYYFKLLTYVMLENIPKFSVDEIIYKRKYKKINKDKLKTNLENAKITENQYKSCCLKYTKREVIQSLFEKLIDYLNNSDKEINSFKEANNINEDSKKQIRQIIEEIETPDFIKKFTDIGTFRNHFAHESVVYNLEFFNLLKKDGQYLISKLEMIDLVLNNCLNGIAKMPIKWKID